MSLHHLHSTIHLHSKSAKIKLKNILRVPQIKKSLVSISKLTLDNDVYVEFHVDHCVVMDNQTEQVLVQGILENGLYVLGKS